MRASELRVIGERGEQIGILSRQEALEAANEAGLDLVEISPSASPPVVKIIDWGKYQYQKTKEQQKARAKSKSSEMKQIRVGLKIGANDLDIKLRKVRKFLEEGHKVRLTVVFKGREMAHKELGFEMIKKIQELLGEEVVTEQQPSLAGRNLSITIRSK
ncbi:translation initiation factor IF-3 [Candidatus Saccharibacteria bacterium RIFCSPHIGHO2_12_FULL_42_8]|nr:MAG: translation initiation factor IF-3 [Candidatus Saccharibacteria bacterium RIFCSPHIGHO2_12_FULL_42_8]